MVESELWWTFGGVDDQVRRIQLRCEIWFVALTWDLVQVAVDD